MIDFPKGYFDEEERCGFTVTHMMKCAWAAQLEVLRHISEICEKHQLKYFAYFGTLLGAVRHKGYIPWDDDMDIAMKREDYLQFLLYAKEELPREYCILSPYTNDEWTDGFTRITNECQIAVSEEHLRTYHGCPFAVGIDVFPLDFIPKDQKIRTIQYQMLQLAKDSYYSILYLRNNGEAGLGSEAELAAYKQKLAKDIKTLESFTGISRQQAFSLQNWVLRMFDALCMMCGERDADTIGSFQIHMKRLMTGEVSKEALSKSVKMCFEVIYIDVPSGYEEVLQSNYGDFRKLRFAPYHDYPFYKKQIPLMQGKHIWDEEELKRELERPVADHLNSYQITVSPMPDVWSQQISMAKAIGKKVVLISTSIIDLLMLEEKYLVVLENTFQSASQMTDGFFWWWMPDKIDGYIYGYMRPEIVHEYKRIYRIFEDHHLGIIDESGEIERAVKEADIYYGDRTDAYDRCLSLNKPHWLQLEDNIQFCKFSVEKNIFLLPDSWKFLLEKENGEKKKVILYVTDMRLLNMYGNEYLMKIQYVLNVFKEYMNDILLIWKPYPGICERDREHKQILLNQFGKIVDNFQNEAWGIFDDSEKWESALSCCDGYFGDDSSMVQICKARYIPVMIQDVHLQ